MSRFIEPPPNKFDEGSILNWLRSVYQAIDQLENFTVTNLSATTTLTSEQSGLVLIANTTAITLTLPKAANMGAGFKYYFIKTTTDAQIVTLDGDGSETINGAATSTLIDAQYDTLGLVPNGTGRLIYSRYIS